MEAAAGTPSQGAAAARMGITSPTLSYLLRGKRISESAVHALCDGINQAWGTPTAPAVTTDQRLEGLRRASAVVDSKPRPSRDQEALYEAEEARHQLEQAATARIALEARLSAAEGQVRTLEGLLATAGADSAAIWAELQRAREEVRRLESDLHSARLEHGHAQAEFDLRRAELEAAIEEEIQERLRVQDKLSHVRAQLASAQQLNLVDRSSADRKILQLEHQIKDLHIRASGAQAQARRAEQAQEQLASSLKSSLESSVALDAFLESHHARRPTRSDTRRRPGSSFRGGFPLVDPGAEGAAGRARSHGRQDQPPWPKQFLWGGHSYRLSRTALLCWLLAQFLIHSIGSGFMQLVETPDQALWKVLLYTVIGAIVALAAVVGAHLFFSLETDFTERDKGGRVLIALGCVPLVVLVIALLFPYAIYSTQVFGSWLKWPISH